MIELKKSYIQIRIGGLNWKKNKTLTKGKRQRSKIKIKRTKSKTPTTTEGPLRIN